MSNGLINKTLQRKIDDRIQEIAAIASEMPGVVIIHNLITRSVEYISNRGEELLGVSLKEIKLMGPAYNVRFFNPEDAEDYLPKIYLLLEHNNMKEIISFFQQVKTVKQQEWVWHISSVKILMQDDEGKPLLAIVISIPIDPLKHITTKVERLLEENNFLRANALNFKKLSQRECEVLRLLALGKSAPETAEILFITNTTVETHRKNIKQKLGTNSFFELCQYARAFDLV